MAISEKVIFPYVEDDELVGVVDFKTQFQEYVHSQNRGDVTYRLIKEEGPASSIVYVGSHFRE